MSSSSSVGSRSQTASNSVCHAYRPEFLRLQLQFDVRSIGLLLIAPNILCTVCSIAAGFIADSCIVRGVNVTVVRKVFQTVSQLIPAVATILIGYLHSTVGVIVAITLAVGLAGAGSAGYGANFLDVAPQYASITLAVANSFGALSGIVAPIVVGSIVNPPHDDIEHWREAFVLAAIVSIIGWVPYMIFGTGAYIKHLSLEKSDDSSQSSRVPCDLSAKRSTEPADSDVVELTADNISSTHHRRS